MLCVYLFYLLSQVSVKVAYRIHAPMEYGQFVYLQLLFRPGRNINRKKVILIKEISKKDLDFLVSKGIIGRCHADNPAAVNGYFTSGFYDVKRCNSLKRRTPEASNHYLKTVAAHVGVTITRNHIYIEDKYVDMLRKEN